MENEKTKLYAVTLNPECFDYRVYDISEDDGNEVYVDGGRNFSDIDNKGYLKAIKKLINEFNSWDYEHYYGNSIMAFLNDYLPKKENGKKLSAKEAHEIKTILVCYENIERTIIEIIETCLSIITGKIYKTRYLRGCCQGDVVKAYYPVENGIAKYLDYVEAVYFGTGTEIMIHEEDNEPTKAEEVSGYTFYTASWKTEDLKREIKECCGCKGDDNIEVILWLYDKTRTIHIDEYKLAD